MLKGSLHSGKVQLRPILFFQCRFLLEVSESQEMNKMDSHNLALLFNPCLFPVDEEGFSGKKNPDPKTKSFNTKVDLVEILINHGKRVR